MSHDVVFKDWEQIPIMRLPQCVRENYCKGLGIHSGKLLCSKIDWKKTTHGLLLDTRRVFASSGKSFLPTVIKFFDEDDGDYYVAVDFSLGFMIVPDVFDDIESLVAEMIKILNSNREFAAEIPLIDD